MSGYALRLFEDQLPKELESPVSLPAGNRVIYVVEGDVTISVGHGGIEANANMAWQSADSCTLSPGVRGARLWRWELVRLPVQHQGLLAGERVVSSEILVHDVMLDPRNQYLMRCDRVDFPPGEIAYTHTHQGPGIRCLLFGEFTVQVHGEQTDFHPGEAWFEIGPDPVYAAASQGEPAAFVRVMILPRSLKGKSSIRYVKPEDQDKPKAQKYTVFIDEAIDI